MGTIEEIIIAIDNELIETGREYLTLGQANKLLVDEGIMSIPERNNQALKTLLESDQIFHAFKTNGSPRQWRIPYSKGKKKFKALNNEKKQINNESEFSEIITNTTKDQISCPKCGILMYFPKNLKKESLLQCLICGESFHNPLKTSSTSKNQRNWLIGISVFLLFFIYLKSSNNNSQKKYSPTLFYINKESLVATNKAAFDQMFRYSIDGDYEALASLFQTGEVLTLNAGTEVFIVSTHFSYHIIRQRGSTQNLYIVMENVTQK